MPVEVTGWDVRDEDRTPGIAGGVGIDGTSLELAWFGVRPTGMLRFRKAMPIVWCYRDFLVFTLECVSIFFAVLTLQYIHWEELE